MANTVGTLNPIRYRGYYYDVETGLYYLQSRYYDPETGRFISPDVIAEGGNIYTYCLNDPVNRSDESGYLSRRDKNIIKVAIGVVATVAAVAITVATGGAALPVIAGVAASTLIGAGISAGITALQGGSDEEIFDSAVDGAIDGFMWGGISAFASASIGAITSSLNATKVANNASTRSINLTQGACFIAGTLILTEKGIEEIENIKIGDYVLSYNERTGDKEYKKVVNTFNYLKTELYHIITNDNQKISVTPEHPFYVLGEGWIMAKDLIVGDMFFALSGNTVAIREIRHEFLKEPILVYNFEVSENHNYFVLGKAVLPTASFILVLNTCGTNNISKTIGDVGQYKGVRIDLELGASNQANIHMTSNSLSKKFYWDGSRFVGAPRKINKSNKVIEAVVVLIEKAQNLGWPL